MTNNTIIHNIPDILFSVLEFSGCVCISFILGICWERTCRRSGRVDIT